MAIRDDDFELLGTYLDGELPVTHCEALWRRLAAEPDLAAELETQRQDRAVRRQVWAAIEPSPQAVEQLQSKLGKAARRHDAYIAANRMARIVCTAAACIVFGFAVGWMGRDKTSKQAALQTAPLGSDVRHIADTGNKPANPLPAPNHPSVVTVVDDYGQIVSEHAFATQAEAQAFIDALNPTPAHQQQAAPSQVVPVAYWH